MSVEFFGVGGLGQIGSIKKGEKPQPTSKADKAQGGDQVQFSSVLQDVNKTQTEANDIDRAERVAALKQQVASGSYEPDLNKVASSLLQFLMEVK